MWERIGYVVLCVVVPVAWGLVVVKISNAIESTTHGRSAASENPNDASPPIDYHI